MTNVTTQSLQETSHGFIGKIPIRNLWLLMLYASELFRNLEKKQRAGLEENPDDIPNLVAEILCCEVQRRLQRNLSYGHITHKAIVNRLRGHILLLDTERQQLLNRGKIACRFDALTMNTPRNRFVKAALGKIAQVASPELAHRCRGLAFRLRRLGVSGECPSRAEVSMERFGRHDKEDQSMISAARLAFNLALPTEEAGQNYLSSPNREEQWIRKLYEKSIAGFYKTVLSLYGWHVYAGTKIEWPITQKSEGIDKILPSMQTDIILDPTDSRPRIVIDTKFNEIVEKGLYREESLRSEYIYQIYAYLRSQEEKGPKERNATGLLLHPAIKENYNEFVCIQNHKIKFATVDLTATTKEIRRRLLEIVEAI